MELEVSLPDLIWRKKGKKLEKSCFCREDGRRTYGMIALLPIVRKMLGVEEFNNIALTKVRFKQSGVRGYKSLPEMLILLQISVY